MHASLPLSQAKDLRREVITLAKSAGDSTVKGRFTKEILPDWFAAIDK